MAGQLSGWVVVVVVVVVEVVVVVVVDVVVEVVVVVVSLNYHLRIIIWKFCSQKFGNFEN